MNTRIVMGASALVMALLGLAASFLPQEVLEYAGEQSTGLLPFVIQVVGALYLGFAFMNWMAKDSLIGGIYNRPVAIGNFLHFTVGALALGKGAVAHSFNTPLVLAAIVYAIFAIAFAIVFFTSPVKRTDTPSAA